MSIIRVEDFDTFPPVSLYTNDELNLSCGTVVKKLADGAYEILDFNYLDTIYEGITLREHIVRALVGKILVFKDLTQGREDPQLVLKHEVELFNSQFQKTISDNFFELFRVIKKLKEDPCEHRFDKNEITFLELPCELLSKIGEYCIYNLKAQMFENQILGSLSYLFADDSTI